MKIQKINLIDYKGHKDLSLEFESNLTVIYGENGAGKSSLLDAISISLSWIVARLKNQRGQGKFIDKIDINNYAKECYITSNFDEINNLTLFNNSFVGNNSKLWSFYEDLKKYVSNIHSRLAEEEKINLPVFAYYGVRRAVIDVPLRVKNKLHDSIFETYDNWDKGGANFKSFFEWFRYQEDIENEKIRYWNNGANLFEIAPENTDNGEQNKFQPDRELSTVRRALESFMPNYKNVRVSRRPLRMLIDKGDDTLNIEQLSDGEKIYFALIGDLCRRLVLANPTMEDPLQGEGIVLIDEIDLHLHPNWQKDIAVRLTDVFPNVQFIVTTHSSLVFNNVPSDKIRVLTDNGVRQPQDTYGLPLSIILKDEMGLTNEMPREIELSISDFAHGIDKKDYNLSSDAYNRLKQLSPQHPELIRMNFFLSGLNK